MAAIGGLLPLFKGLISGFQSFQRAQDTSRQLENQAAMQRSQAAFQQAQAQVYSQQAQAALAEGQAAKDKQRKAALRGLGTTAAGYLGRGVSLAGSPLAVLGAQAGAFELEGQELLYQGRKASAAKSNQASFARFRAAQDLQQADLLDARAKQTTQRAGASLLGSALGSFGNFASSFSPAPQQAAPKQSFQQPRYMGIGRF